jgi:hypothetical protein
MRPHIPSAALAVLCLLLPLFTSQAEASDAASGRPAVKAGMDSSQVRNLYQNGDFEPAIRILEDALGSGKVRNHHDSIFVYKHLGVMYAASEHTRERGKYYMLQLLTIEPTARIMDMYASDMIYMIFRNIQEEFSLSHRQMSAPAKDPARPDQPDRPGRTRPASTAKPPVESGHGKTIAWVGAAALAVGTGVTLYVLSNSEPSPTRKNHEVK